MRIMNDQSETNKKPERSGGINFVWLVELPPSVNHVNNSPSRYTYNQALMENSVSGFLFYARFVLGFGEKFEHSVNAPVENPFTENHIYRSKMSHNNQPRRSRAR